MTLRNQNLRNDRAPVYLSNSISIFIPTREGLRSSMDILRLDVPRSNRQYGLRSFSQFGPSLWNKVPPPLILCSKRNSKRTCSNFFCAMSIFDICLYFLFTFCLVFYSIYFCFVKRFDQLWKGAIVSIVYVCMYVCMMTLWDNNLRNNDPAG